MPTRSTRLVASARRATACSLALVLAVLWSSLVVAGIRAQEATPAAEPDPVPVAAPSDATMGYPALTVIATDTGFSIPDGFAAGRYFVTTQNAGTFWSHYFTLRVPDAVTDEEFFASMESEEDPAWLFEAEVVGNPDQTLPGRETQAIVDYAAGRYVLIDPIRGLAGMFSVAADASAMPSPPVDPASDVDIVMKEMLFEGLGETMPAGRTVWKVTNAGAVWHEAVIIRVPDGTTTDSLLAEANTGEDEGPDDAFIDSLVGGSAVVSPGLTSWMILDLEPGTYAAICTFPSDNGRVHAMDGMLKVFTVS